MAIVSDHCRCTVELDWNRRIVLKHMAVRPLTFGRVPISVEFQGQGWDSIGEKSRQVLSVLCKDFSRIKISVHRFYTLSE